MKKITILILIISLVGVTPTLIATEPTDSSAAVEGANSAEGASDEQKKTAEEDLKNAQQDLNSEDKAVQAKGMVELIKGLFGMKESDTSKDAGEKLENLTISKKAGNATEDKGSVSSDLGSTTTDNPAPDRTTLESNERADNMKTEVVNLAKEAESFFNNPLVKGATDIAKIFNPSLNTASAAKDAVSTAVAANQLGVTDSIQNGSLGFTALSKSGRLNDPTSLSNLFNGNEGNTAAWAGALRDGESGQTITGNDGTETTFVTTDRNYAAKSNSDVNGNDVAETNSLWRSLGVADKDGTVRGFYGAFSQDAGVSDRRSGEQAAIANGEVAVFQNGDRGAGYVNAKDRTVRSYTDQNGTLYTQQQFFTKPKSDGSPSQTVDRWVSRSPGRNAMLLETNTTPSAIDAQIDTVRAIVNYAQGPLNIAQGVLTGNPLQAIQGFNQASESGLRELASQQASSFLNSLAQSNEQSLSEGTAATDLSNGSNRTSQFAFDSNGTSIEPIGQPTPTGRGSVTPGYTVTYPSGTDINSIPNSVGGYTRGETTVNSDGEIEVFFASNP